MKFTFLVAATLLTLASCNNSAKTSETSDKQAVASVSGATSYKIDSTATITWIGSKPTGKHTGTFNLSNGEFLVKDNTLAGGSFTINMASITNQDLAGDPDNKTKLEGHLKSPDFFNIEKYPTAQFVITSVEPYVANPSDTTKSIAGATHLVRGNLTLKDSTKNVAFPAVVTIDGATATASADFNIDRTQWGMNYKGPGNPQDWFISKLVNIKFSITARHP